MSDNVDSIDTDDSDYVVPESISEFYGQVKLLVESMEEDALKANKGNKAAGVRLRKSLRYLKSRSGEFVKFTLAK